MKLSVFAFAVAALAAGTLPSASAQAAATPPESRSLANYHLMYATTSNEQNEILTAIRNIASRDLRVMLVPSTGQIAVSGSPEDIKIIEQLLPKLDVPHKLYRLTYTFTETDNGKRIGLQRYSMLLAPGQRMQMKEGSRVPVVTGTIGIDDPKPKKQNTYLDIGLNFDSQVDTYGPNGVRLRSKVEQSSVAERSGVGDDDPLIRQAILEGNTVLTEGKPQILGAMDVVDSTRHLDVEALVEVVH